MADEKEKDLENTSEELENEVLEVYWYIWQHNNTSPPVIIMGERIIPKLNVSSIYKYRC